MRYCLTILTVLMIASPAWAAEYDQPATDIHMGSAALMFDMGGIFNSTPANFEGIGIGGRFALKENVHIRGAVGIDNSSDEYDPENGNTSNDESSWYGVEGGLDYILVTNSNLMIYTGGIVQLGTSSDDPEGENNETDGTSLTLAGVLGATWFFTQNVSLGAEYRLGIERVSTETDAGKGTKTKLGTGSAAFHVGFWF